MRETKYTLKRWSGQEWVILLETMDHMELTRAVAQELDNGTNPQSLSVEQTETVGHFPRWEPMF